MKKVSCTIKNSYSTLLIGMILLNILPTNAMDNQANLWTVYSQPEGLQSSIQVTQDVLELSQTIKNMLEDIGTVEKVDLPLYAPSPVIANVFGFLKAYKNEAIESIDQKINSLSFAQLINDFILLNYLDVPIQLNDIFITKIRNSLFTNSAHVDNPAFKQLDPDIQRFLMFPIISDLLKETSMLDQTIEQRKIALLNTSGDLINILETIYTAAFSPDSDTVVIGCSGANNLIMWNNNSGQMLYNLKGHPEGVHTIAFSPDGKKIVSGGDGPENNLIVWDALSGQIIHNLKGHTECVRTVAFSADGTKIISGSDGPENNLIIWDALSGQMLHNLKGHPESVLKVVVSPDNSTIVSCSSSKNSNLITWDIHSGDRIHHLVGHNHAVATVAISPNGQKIASGSVGNKNNLIIWDAHSGHILHNLKEHPSSVSTVAFSPDSEQLVSGGNASQNNLIVWNSNSGQKIYNLEGHPYNVFAAMFSPSEHQIISGSTDLNNNLIIWDTLSGQIIRALQADPNGVTTVALSPNGHKIISSGLENNPIVWTLLTNQEADTLHKIKKCNLEELRTIFKTEVHKVHNQE